MLKCNPEILLTIWAKGFLGDLINFFNFPRWFSIGKAENETGNDEQENENGNTVNIDMNNNDFVSWVFHSLFQFS